MKPTKQVVQCAHMTLVPPLYRGYGDSDHPLDKEGYEINNLVKDIAELVRYATSAHAQMCWDFDVTCNQVVRKGWFSNTSFTTGLKTLPTLRPDALVFFRVHLECGQAKGSLETVPKVVKKTRASGRNIGKVFNPVVKLVLENQPFLMLEPAEKPSLQSSSTVMHT